MSKQPQPQPKTATCAFCEQSIGLITYSADRVVFKWHKMNRVFACLGSDREPAEVDATVKGPKAVEERAVAAAEVTAEAVPTEAPAAEPAADPAPVEQPAADAPKEEPKEEQT